MRKLNTFPDFLPLLLFLGIMQLQSSPIRAESDDPLLDSLDDEQYAYPVELDSGQYIFGEVKQISSDLAVEIHKPR